MEDGTAEVGRGAVTAEGVETDTRRRRAAEHAKEMSGWELGGVKESNKKNPRDRSINLSEVCTFNQNVPN